MRKFLIGILLAGAAASPALAQQDNERRPVWGTHSDSRPERPAPRENRAERSNAERPQQAQRPQAEARPQYQARQQDSSRGNYDRSRWQGGERAAPQQIDPRQAYDRGTRDGRRDWRNRYDGAQQQPQQQVEQARRSGSWTGDRSNWQGRDRDGDRSNWQGRYRDGSRWASGGWNRDWRNDRRYDWRRYRDRHRSVFRLGVYFDPFGYGYRSFGIGYRLQPVYFGQRYWIDPAMYQLPYPPPGTQWVRYWNDAVLVDMYTGEVVDVIHNFFW
jgi:Ni/Co efflux regulator RcnB